MQFAFMVYDQLFSVDENYEPHPQMVESYTVSDDRKSYRFTLRPGLKFHDGSPVRRGRPVRGEIAHRPLQLALLSGELHVHDEQRTQI